MKGNPLIQLGALGQSIWLDYIRRDLIADGRLRRLIEDEGVQKSNQPFDTLMETLAQRSPRH